MPLHTLMFGWEFPPLHSGGLGVACQGLVRGLRKNNTDITLILPMNVANIDEAAVRSPESGVTIRYVQSDIQPYDTSASFEARVQSRSAGHIDHLYGPNLGDAVQKFTDQSVELTADLSPDVIHCHDWMTYDAGIKAAAYHKVPLVMHIHATELDRTDFKPHIWIADKERFGLLKADKVIAVSNYTKQQIMTHYGIPENKIAVVHNGHEHDPSPSHITDMRTGRPSLVLFLGRLTVQKNPWQFLETAKVIHEHRPDVFFAMAGDGGMLGELVDRACALGLNDRMLFTGKVNKNEVDDLFRQASCFVMPSVSEPFGLVALEAIGHGVPVVISKQSGAAEVIDHAFKVDFWDTERFADCILTILREQPLAEQLSAEAPRILNHLTWQNQARLVQSIYHDIIQS